MVYKITDDCINCGVCIAECPFNAVFPPGVNWRNLHDKNFLFINAPAYRDSYYSEKYSYIVPELCSGCKGFSDEPKCVIACPLGCIVDDNLLNKTTQTNYNSNIFYETLRNSYKVIRFKYAGKET